MHKKKNFDPATSWQKFHSFLRVVAREKIPIVHSNWKNVPETLKDMVWGDILVSHINNLMYSNIEFIFKKMFTCTKIDMMNM